MSLRELCSIELQLGISSCMQHALMQAVTIRRWADIREREDISFVAGNYLHQKFWL
jgi:hypothetical protein